MASRTTDGSVAAVASPSQPQVLDRPDFKTVEFINQLFPTEESLVGIDPLIHKLRNRIRRVDAEIIEAVRKQSTSGSKAKEDLLASTRAIQELSVKMREIKGKAEQSEVMVHEICRDIKKLDYAKKHITATITALNRLAMLVSAVDHLQALTANRQYRDAASQLQAVTQLLGHFEAYRDIPKIFELGQKVESLKATLKSHIFSDFSSLATMVLKDNVQVMQQLADACLAVDALDLSARDELVRSVCSKELTAYQQIFQGTDVAKLEKAERRYIWIKRQMKSNEEVWRLFPSQWRVYELLCMQFCKITRAQLMEQLDTKDRPDVATLLQALERTLEFEEELAARFGAEQASEGEEGDPAASAESTTAKAAAKQKFNFRGAISSCFEPHLSVYVDLEERTLLETLDKLMQEETWEADESGETHILRSSTEMFLAIRKSFNRCCQLSRQQTLLNLFRVFQRVLRMYAGRLTNRLPRAGPTMGNAEWQVKMSEKDERVICYIVNTAEYCYDTAAQLAESVESRIEEQYASQIDMSAEQEEFSGVITRALSVLVVGMETRLDVELENMTRVAWATMETVGDQSEYVNNISAVFSNSVPMLAALLSSIYFQFFLDKMAASFAPRFYANIFKCKRISGTGVQQMLLDTHAVKTVLMELPALGRQVATPTYAKYVARELGRAEALLKVILSPMSNIADTFQALLPEGTATDYQRILELKGVKKLDQQPLVDAMAKKLGVAAAATATAAAAASSQGGGRGQAQGSSGSSGPGAGAASGGGALSAASTGVTNRDAMIARAAALGRDAVAQSAAAAAAVSQTQSATAAAGALKRIFALADGSGSKKDMGFRGLFGPQ